jgi:hypothetical protein
LAMPSSWRSRRRFVSNSAKTICLELGEDPEHVQEALAGGRAGVDRLLGRLEARAASPHCADDVLQIADAPGEAIDAGDRQDVVGVQEFQHSAERLTAFGRGSAPLVGSDDLAACPLERRLLDRQVLIGGAHPGISDDGHGPGLVVSFGSRPRFHAVYRRAAFPDAFVRRMDKTGVSKRLAKNLEPHGAFISFVYFNLDDGRVLERPDGEPYELSIVLVYPPGDDAEMSAEMADDLAEAVKEDCDARLADKKQITIRAVSPFRRTICL